MHALIPRARVIICLLVVVSIAPMLNGTAGAQPSGVFPVLRTVVASAPASGLIAVHGDGFTAGGLVSIVLYDRWGQHRFEVVRTTASPGQYGPNGSADPANGYVEPGTLDYLLDLAPVAVYGQNGSADPANGYQPSGAGWTCGQQLMIRAYDARSDIWTNLLDIEARC